MTKNIKRSITVFLTLILAVVLSACSMLQFNKSAENILNKTADTAKSIKNTDFVSTNVSEIVNGEQTHKVDSKISGSIIFEPFTLKTISETKSQNITQKSELYVKDNVIYTKSSGQNSWIKNSNDNVTSQFQNLKNIAYSEKIFEFYKKLAKDFQVTEENGNYVLTYSGSGEQFKELMVEIVNSASGSQQVDTNTFNDVNFKNVSIRYVITKKFIPVDVETTMDLEIKNNIGSAMKLTQKISYTNVNNVSDISLPNDVKNATELKTD
ncbi:DUF6612 family protein [Gemella bergeri]|nr:DUF6612 family protein [Gemella bergeri]